MSDKEKSKSQKLEEKLLASLEYLSDQELTKVRQAIVFSREAHKGMKRYSGDDYIVHPLGVALKLAKLKLDHSAIISAILHDTVEDTPVTTVQIRKLFTSEIANMVESVTKLSSVRIKKTWFPIIKQTQEEISQFERQAETLRKMLIAMSKDVRVIIIKLADKIHNLETLQYLPPDKQERIAREAIEIYAPIAGRLGMGEWRGELEDLAFPFVYPEESKAVFSLAIPAIKEREKYLKRLTIKLEKILKENEIKTDINFRAKKWFSLFKKLQKYNNNLDKVYDLIAVRIIVDSIEDCYGTLGVIHSMWRPLVGRIKDYVALPKPNGYQSIHTTVFADEGKIVEFQIRTRKMHQQAEFGIASHWIYADKKMSKLPNKDELKWIDDFYRVQKQLRSPEELFKYLKMDVFEDRIFVFTPQGDVKDLPAGATPIDFAYSVHTALGNKCTGSKVNGKIAPIDSSLHNGDIVEIIKKENAKPHADWLKFVRTDTARTQIKKQTGKSLH